MVPVSTPPIDLTVPVLGFLKSDTLTKISINRCFYVKTAPIFDALKHNESVQQLAINQSSWPSGWHDDLKALAHVLWHHNTTLASVVFVQGSTKSVSRHPEGYHLK
jgi:hypothetical protein